MTDKRRVLIYIRNTAGNARIQDFDDDHEPIGPLLRNDLMPEFFREDEHGKLVLTPAGKAEIEA